MGLYLGEGLKFYNRYFWWDLLVHFLAGITFVNFGIAIASTVDNLSTFHILFFSLSFSVFLHTLWEVFEYVLDCISRTNHQRWQKNTNDKIHLSKSALQPAGLVDTMHDMVASIVGSLAACVVWCVIL